MLDVAPAVTAVQRCPLMRQRSMPSVQGWPGWTHGTDPHTPLTQPSGGRQSESVVQVAPAIPELWQVPLAGNPIAEQSSGH
jgi:hypothetical protein